MTSTNQPQERGEGFLGGIWCFREGFVTPAGFGVSVPPRGKSLPSSLQFKPGTKLCVCVFFLLFLFLFYLVLCFCCRWWCVCVCVWEGSGVCPWALHLSLSSTEHTVQEGGSALLRPNIVQCCWCVEKGVSARLRARSSCSDGRQLADPRPLRWQVGIHVTAWWGDISQSLFGLFVGMIKALPTQDLR